MVVLSLVVNGQIERSVLRSVSTGELWAAKFARVSALGGLAATADAPGNDVFLSRDIPGERARMRAAYDSFMVQVTRARSVMPESLPPEDGARIIAGIGRGADGMDSMRTEAESVFALMERGREMQASRHMAQMDGWFTHTLRALRTLRADLGGVQDALMREQRTLAERSSRLLHLAGIVVFLLALGGGWLGYRLAREAEEQAEARDRTMGMVAQAQAELEVAHTSLTAAHKELESFSYSVAHDLRAPLRSIHGFSDALVQDSGATLDAQGHAHLDRIKAASLRMERLIDDLLRLSRVTRQTLVATSLDLSALADEVIAELRALHPERRVEVAVARGLRADADPSLARVLLQNLLGNAWKFTRHTPGARIIFEQEPVTVLGAPVFVVRDNGAGFDMTYAKKLFGAFQRMHSASEFEGTGVGLATAQRIVQRHGGRIEAAAEVGRGATFRFTLRR